MSSITIENAQCIIDSKVNPIRVLHVDDDAACLQISKLMLEEMDNCFDVDWACSVKEATAKLATNIYDVILSDYDMPQENGLDFLRELREQENRIPFVLFTGKGREEVAVQALNLGANGYVNKQGDTETVYGELAYCIKNAFAYRKAELDLKASEAKYHELVDRLPEMVLEIDDKGRIVFANRRVFELTGYFAEDFDDDFDANRLVAPEDVERSRRNMKEMFAGNIRQSSEYTFLKKDGTRFPVLLTSVPVMKGNKPVGARGIVVDLTERKKAECILARNQTLLESIVNSTKDLIWSVTEEDFLLLTFNNALNDYFIRTQGLQLQTGMTTGIMPTKEREEQLRALYRKTLDQGPFTVEYTTLKDPRVLELTFSVLKHQDKPFAIAVFGKDITERKKAEAALLESENKYRELANLLPEIIFEVDAEANMTFANARAFELTGYSKKDLERGINAFSIIAPEDTEKAKADVITVLSGNTLHAAEYSLVRKDGTQFPVSMSTSPIVREGRVIGARGIAFSLTHRRNL